MEIDVHLEAQTQEPQEESAARLELKYCEGCGALTLRPATSSEIYCPRCAKKFAQIARQKEADRLAAANRRKS